MERMHALKSRLERTCTHVHEEYERVMAATRYTALIINELLPRY